MSFTLLSVLFILLFAVIAFKEIYRNAKKGFHWAIISLGADVLALFISFLVNSFLANIAADSIMREIQRIEGYDDFIAMLPSLSTVLRAVVTMVLGSIFYIFVFLILRALVRGVALYAYRSRTEQTQDDPGYGCEDRSFADRSGRVKGAVCGFLSAVILVSALSAPMMGTLEVADHVLHIIKQTDTRVYESIGPGNAALVHSFTKDISANVFYQIGGKTIYSGAASCYISGKKMHLLSELKTISAMSEDMLNVYKIFLYPQEATQEHVDSLRRLSENMQKLKLCEALSAELVSGCATAWKNGETFLTICAPAVPASMKSVFNGVLTACSNMQKSNVKQNTETMLEAYALILESGVCGVQYDDYNGMLQQISNSNMLIELETLLLANTYTKHIDVSEVAMSAMAPVILQSGAFKDALISEIADALKEVNASGKNATAKETSLTSSLRNIFGDRGISVSSSFMKYAARRMIKELPGQNVDVNDITRLLEKYAVSAG